MRTTSLALAAISFLCTRSLGIDIETKEEFLIFSERIYLGDTYKGKTLYLQNDIDLSGDEYTPLGAYAPLEKTSVYFQGTFDGQGHTITNLNLNSSEYSTGLFGFISGGAVRNIVIDDSCSITVQNTPEDYDEIFVGGLAGVVDSSKGTTTIQNIVNMADISVVGYAESSVVGGIVGYMSFEGYEIELYNSMNLGNIYLRENDENLTYTYPYIGGITGYLVGSTVPAIILNCLNLGNIFVSSVYTNIFSYMGGIAGVNGFGTIGNSVNMGTFYTDIDGDVSSYFYIGQITPEPFGDVFNCYSNNASFIDEIEDFYYSMRYSDCGVFNDDFMLQDETTVGRYTGKSLVSALNTFNNCFYFYSLSEWLINKNEKTVSFLPSGTAKKAFKIKSGIILSPKIADRDNYHFYGWYSDATFKTLFTSNEVDEDITLYGKYDIYDKEFTITFDTNGTADIEPIKANFGEIVPLPKKEGGEKMIGMWEYRVGDETYGAAETNFLMPSYDITLYAVWINTVIRTPEDFKKFSDSVNNGVSYAGITVLLDNDLNMKGTDIDKIGGSGQSFAGTFDGNGYTISNLDIIPRHKNIQDAGLFSFSSVGMTVRNLILDKSCKVTGNYNPTVDVSSGDISGAFTGGIIGYCYAGENSCILQNSMNMGTVRFKGANSESGIMIGGLVGTFKAYNSHCKISNSVFMGTALNTGSSDYDNIYIGGIAGYVYGDLDVSQSIIENSLNAGTITFSGEPNKHFMGGIIGGFEINVIVQNCVNIGTLHTGNVINATMGQIAGIVSNAAVQNGYWESNSTVSVCGKDEKPNIGNNSEFNSVFNLDDTVSAVNYRGYSLISALNSYTSNRNDLSRWVGNAAASTISFVVDGNTVLSVQSKIILLPFFSSRDEKHFFGWFEDPDAMILFTEKEVSGDMRLYGTWKNATSTYTATFVSEGIIVKTVNVKAGETVKTSGIKPQKSGYTFIGWIDEYEKKVDSGYKVQARDIKFTALWLKEKLSTADDVVEFSYYVGKGVDCNKRVIELTNDIDMEEVTGFAPIGTSDNPFKGTFEGHGYRIKNLKIRSAAQYTGFFGYILDATVRNIIIDESCSVESTYMSGYGSVGGVVGYCATENKKCVVVNAVNYASVALSKDSAVDGMNLGGVVGLCQCYYTGCIINNCANYGTVTQAGNTSCTWMGGVVGRCGGYSDNATCELWNSLNYGNISHSGEIPDPDSFGVGGILGACYENTNVSGCVSGGTIKMNSQRILKVGAITGKNRDLCAVTENVWFWSAHAIDTSGKNPELGSDLKTADGETAMVLLKTYSESRKLPKEGKVGTYRTTWIVNPENARVTAKVGGREIASYNSSIVLLPTFLEGNKYHFNGWYNGGKKIGTSSVSKDITLDGKWEKEKDMRLTIGLSVGIPCFVLLVIVAVVLTFYGIRYMKWRKGRKECRDLLYPKTYDKPDPEDSLNKKKDFYPDSYTKYGDIKLREALKTAGLKDELANKVIDCCMEKALELEGEDKLPRGVTVEDAAAIAMYTFDFGKENLRKSNPYFIINAALRERKSKELDKAKDLIYLVMKALRKLPVIHGKDLYRGIIVDVAAAPSAPGGSKANLRLEDYKKGVELTWEALSSTSPDIEVTKAFLASRTGPGLVGVLFQIKGGWGYDVQPYSLFPTESEILLEPERQFVIEGVIAQGLVVVNLKMHKTPILFPSIYGMHNLKTSPYHFVKEKAVEAGYDFKRKQRQNRNFDDMFNEDANWEGRDKYTGTEINIPAKEEMTRGEIELNANMTRGEIELHANMTRGEIELQAGKGGIELQNMGK